MTATLTEMRHPAETKSRTGLICANSPIDYVDSDGLSPLNIVYYLPPGGSTEFVLPGGPVFYAPYGTNFQTVLEAGENNSYLNGAAFGLGGYAAIQIITTNSNIGQYGQFDFQRNFGMGNQDTNFFFTQYTNASNFAVGVYEYGTGRSLGAALQMANAYANLFSNGSSPWRQFYQILGYTTAMFGFPPGFGCMESNPLSSPFTLQLNLNSPTTSSSSGS